jgi:hypothetical protein
MPKQGKIPDLHDKVDHNSKNSSIIPALNAVGVKRRDLAPIEVY